MSVPEETDQVVDVVVVDDEERARKAMKALLATYAGVSVVGEAGNGADAVTCAGTVHPRVVLMDVHMPIMDGIEATRQIKHRHPGIGVVLLTIDSAMAQAAMTAGADAFLLKGLTGGELVAAVRRCGQVTHV